jgi:conserved hypothetical phage abiD protein
MGNIATTINEQIRILKDRGLIFNDEEKAKEQLLDIGYYRLGFYTYYFQDKNHHFQKGITFDDLISLYYLDTDLKFLLMKIITRIEINFRTKLIYLASNEYKNHSTWFANSKFIEKHFVKDLNLFYNDHFKSNNKTIKKHHDKYENDKYAHAWKTLEFFTFGSILKLFKNIKSIDLKRSIISQYDIKSIKTFSKYMDTIRIIRNISAHGGTFYDYQFAEEIPNNTLISFPKDKKFAPYTGVRVVLHFLKTISENRFLDAEREIKQLFEKYKYDKNISKIITDCIKYIW